MSARRWLIALMVITSISMSAAWVLSCCPAPPSGRPVVNADQTVVILWDAAARTQHFVRRASFKSDADDFGFLIPSPTQPELHESGDGVFPALASVTAPKFKTVPRPTGGGCGMGCSDRSTSASTGALAVKVLDDKIVAGFHAVVLETRSSEALVAWLKVNGYAFSPEVQTWAKPYVEQGWKITALKVAKSLTDSKPDDPAATSPATVPAENKYNVTASALRMTFKTDRPLFPYREPDPSESARQLGVSRRLLRIYFIAEARYQGEMAADARGTPISSPAENQWGGRTEWAGKLSTEDRKRALDLLKLPESTGPAEFWLTEFEDNWPYRSAPGDVYFARSDNQSPLERDPILQYVQAPPIRVAEAASYILVLSTVGLFPMLRRFIGRRA